MGKENHQKISNEEALLRLKHTCSRSEKCYFDIRKKLKDWGLEQHVNNIYECLVAENYINEERYTQAFVNDKIRFSKWGKNKVQYNLKQRGINNDTINNTLSLFSDEEYIEIVKTEIEKKNNSIKEKDKYKRLSKLYNFAGTRGYECDITKKLIDELLSDY